MQGRPRSPCLSERLRCTGRGDPLWIRTVRGLEGLLILAAAAASGAAHALPAAHTDTYAAIYFPITNPLCDPACDFDPTFSHVADPHRRAAASAGFGSVGAEVSVGEDDYSGSPQFIGESQGFMLDNITISGPTGTGSVSFEVGLHGTASTNIPGIVDPSLQFTFSAQGPTAGALIEVHSAVDGFPSGTFTSPSFAYTFGDPITIYMVLLVAMLQHADATGGPLFGDVLYHNTATFTGLTVLDGQGSPVTNYTISSESGTSYPLTVPEPGRAWLLVCGGLTLLGSRRVGTARLARARCDEGPRAPLRPTCRSVGASASG